MATRTSQLIVELLDRVSAPARRVSDALGRVRRSADQGSAGGITASLNGALERTNARLEASRAGVMDAVGAFYVLRGAIAAPVRAAMELESAMADVKKVVNFSDEADVAAFTQDLLDLTKQLPMTVEGLAQIAAAAGQAGIAREDLIGFTEAAAKVGVAFDISADQAGEAMAKMMTGLGMTLPEVVSLSDAMNHLSNAQASSAAEILDVVRRVGAMGKQYGFTAEQTAAFGSAMIASGAQSEVAATSFMNMGRALTRGSSATKRQSDAMKRLGLDAETVARRMQEDAVGTTIDVMERIAALPAEMRAAVSSDLFGDEARALGPLLTNLDLVRESMGLVGDESAYAGSAFQEFAVRSKTFQNRLQLFRNAIARVGVTIGSALLPVLTQMMDRLEPILNAIGEWISANPDLVAGILSAVAAVVALKGATAALTFVGLLGQSGALSLLAAGMATIGRAGAHLAGAARSAVALQTVLLPGGKLAEGFAGPVRHLTGWQRLSAAFRGMIFAVPGVSMLSGAIGAIGAAIATISAPVWAAFAAVAAAVAAAGYTIYKYWDRITSVLSGVAQAIGEILAPAFELIRPVLDWFAPLGDAIAAGWGRAIDVIKQVGEWLGSFFQREILSEEDKASAKQAGYDFVMNLWEGMKQVMAELLAWVKSKAAEILAPFARLGETIRSYLPGSSVTAADNPAGEFSGFEQRAGGGPIRRGVPYIVGEEGPELITPSANGFVHTANETRQMLSGGNPSGGGPVGAAARRVVLNLGGMTINAQPGQDAREIAAEAVRLIEEKIGAALRGVQADTGMEAYG
jgi:TP901 family phage tail tape measure protein